MQEQHVALVDRLEPADARAVEAQAFREAVDLELPDRDAEVLPRPGEVDEPNVHDLDALGLGALDNLFRARLTT